jgi:GTP-binding protein
MKFVDEAKIHLKAGDGGSGSISFFRGPHLPKGGPDGGNGGRGGSIIIRADENLQSLLDFKFKPQYKAKRGEDGRGKNQNGKSAEDLVLRVPLGTRVTSEDGVLQMDLVTNNQEMVAVQGGKGGKGNTAFKSSTRQAPRIATSGESGEERYIFLELKTLSDVGLVGFPNAGKSSLLRALSAATPKVANYPFTTLRPHLGVIGDQSFVMADIPGLIAGAHKDLGLGHKFLRHISRTKILLFVLSFEESQSLEKSYEHLWHELSEYDSSLRKKPFLMAVNKSDLLESSSEFQKDWTSFKKRHPGALLISATARCGLQDLTRALEAELLVQDEIMLKSNQ